VLVVDDDDSVRKVMAQMLTVLGYAVVTATNGLEALDLFDAQREQIDLVITDLRMPVMDGYETVERIKKVKPAARIICMSSHSAVPCPTGARFLPKPFTLASVEECVGRAICD
jgi:CheY-like chemotaxis protein